MNTHQLVFIGLFILGGTVILLGHFHNLSVARNPDHASARAAIPRETVSIGTPHQSSDAAKAVVVSPVPTKAPHTPKRQRPVLDGVPADQFDIVPALEREPKHVPWLPGITGRDRGQVKIDNDAVGWKVISQIQPRAMRIFNTLTPEDCQELVDYAKKFMQRSQVISHNFDGKSEVNQVRTSTGMFMAAEEQRAHPINKKLHARAQALMGLGEDSWIEATQILHYQPGQFYRPHTDYFAASDSPNMNRGGQRIVTMLTWLTDVDEGGETTFPLAHPRPIAAAPAVGQSVLFYDVNEDKQGDPASTHGAEPPKEGSEKWVAVLWCHGRTFV